MARRTAHSPQVPQGGRPTSGTDILSSDSHEQPSASTPQHSLASGNALSGVAGNGPVRASMPPAQPARSHALPMLTAALTASPAKPGGASDGAAERVAYAPRPPPQQQDGGAPTLASDEAGAGQRPGIGPSAPSQDSRPLPRRALASGGRSGDPVLLESFLNAGMHATSAEVQPGPEANELFSEPRHSVEVNSPAAAIREGHPMVRMGSTQQPSGEPTTRPSINGEKSADGVAAGDSDGERGIGQLDNEETEPGITRTSTGEDFEACAGPCGRDGYGDAQDTKHVGGKSQWYDPGRDVVLQIECNTDRQSRARIAFSMACFYIAVVVLIVQTVFRYEKPDRWFLTDNFIYIMHFTIGICCVVAMWAVLCLFAARLARAVGSGKRWSPRRRAMCTYTAALVAMQALNTLCYVAANTIILFGHCLWYAPSVLWLGFIRWECLAVIFVLFWIEGHNSAPYKVKKGSVEGVVLDAPFWRVHWYKVLALVACSAVNVANAVHFVRIAGNPADRCAHQCGLDHTAVVLAAVIVAMFIAFQLAWTFAILSSLRQLQGLRRGSENRIGMISVRRQIITRSHAAAFFILCCILLFYTKNNSCATYSMSWVGFAPVQIALTGIVITEALQYMPAAVADHDNRSKTIMQAWLQAFAWSEHGKPKRMEARARAAPDVPVLTEAPLFCFETAIKMFYWSAMVYRFSSAAEEDNEESATVTMDAAMGLYNLHSFELLWEKALDTKVVMAWSADTCILSFRGTSSFTNVLADLQFWLAPFTAQHDPLEKRRNYLTGRPAVHHGFQKCWNVNGLGASIVVRVQRIAAEAAAKGCRLTVITTGHSLGGALATLAACEIAKACPAADVACYTFGAPRTGNHAFARECNRLVPDNWSIINNQDVVAHRGKMLIYKRPGQRVLINNDGFMQVRPDFAEATLMHIYRGGSVRDHMMTSYRNSFAAVVLRQLQDKGFRDGMQGVIELLGSIHIIQTSTERRKPTRVDAALTQRLTALREDLEAGAAAALPGAAPPTTDSRQLSDAFLRELEGYAGQRPQSAQSGSGGDEGADEVGEAFFQPHTSQRGDRDGTRRSSRRGAVWRHLANNSRGSISRASMWSAQSDVEAPSENETPVDAGTGQGGFTDAHGSGRGSRGSGPRSWRSLETLAHMAWPAPEATPVESSGTFTRTDAGGYIPGPGLETEALHKASMGASDVERGIP